MNKPKEILKVCAFAFGSNLLLFLVKLYVGLSANSISIFSDAVNNLFDSLSGLLTLVCLAAVMKATDISTKGIVGKAEQLLSLMTAIIVCITGFYFAYSSVERLMYPTPVWYAEKYLIMLLLTAAAKLLMWLIYRIWSKKADSPIIKVMSVDCVLDFFITSVTVLTLILSKYETYSIDAIAGIVISTVIVVSSVKMTVSQAKKLINYVSLERRDEVAKAIENIEQVENVTYYVDDEHTSAYIKLKARTFEGLENEIESVKNDCKKNADIDVFFLLS